eukprot:scaffold7740_cov112-Isochrysis_galbana.AAC.2
MGVIGMPRVTSGGVAASLYEQTLSSHSLPVCVLTLSFGPLRCLRAHCQREDVCAIAISIAQAQAQDVVDMRWSKRTHFHYGSPRYTWARYDTGEHKVSEVLCECVCVRRVAARE